MQAESWHLQNKPKIMRQVRFALRHFRKHLVEAYGKEEGEAIASETTLRFEARRLPQGGQRCDFRMSRGQPVEVEPEFLHV